MTELILAVVLIVVSVAIVAYSLWPAKKEEEEAILRRMSGKRSATDQEKRAAPESAAKKLVRKIAPIAVRPVMPKSDEQISALRVKLSNAGFRRESVVTVFLASKMILAIAMAALGLMYGWRSGQTFQNMFSIGATVGGLGFMLPNLWLMLATSQRSEKVRNGLPDALDLLVISVEAGLGLDAAIQRVGDEMSIVHPELAEEFMITTLETQMSVPRSEALEHMATRTGLGEVKSLVAVVTQAERFGTSVAKALRNQAESMRTKRRQKAEERAQKTSVKLMLPLILFIFPAIGVVLAGPAAIQMIRTMSQQKGL